MEHIKLNLKKKTRDRLNILADYIEKLPPKFFTMSTYTMDGQEIKDFDPCNTVGCVVRHAVVIRSRLHLRVPTIGRNKLVNWGCLEHILSEGGIELNQWLFSPKWDSVDNNPKSTAKRIRYTLQNGLPETWEVQMMGNQPLCYLGPKPKRTRNQKSEEIKNAK